MSLERVIIDSATGASPPRFPTNDMAFSPIRFESLNQSTSGKGLCSSSKFLNKENDEDTRENILMKNYSNNCDTTPVLASASTSRPVSLMSLEVNDGYGVYSTKKSSVASTTRHWPVDRKRRYRNGNPYRQHVRHVRGGGRGNGLKRRVDDYCTTSTQIRFGGCNYDHLCTAR